MAEPTKQEIAPMFEAYGAACYEAQHLERSLRLLLFLVQKHTKNNVSRNLVSCTLESEETLRTLGELFKAAQEKEYFTDAERKKINKTIKERNFIVHSYWDKRIQLALKPEGRIWIVSNLNELRELFRSATAIINSLIDKYLTEYGVSVKYFAEKTTEIWESESKPPSSLLH